MLALEEKAMIWEKIFNLLDINYDYSLPITLEVLQDPSYSITNGILKIFSMSTFINDSINEASRFREQNKVQTLGPFCFILCKIFSI